VRKFLVAMIGAVLGFLLGALVGTLCATLWIFVFLADRITGEQNRTSLSSLAQDLALPANCRSDLWRRW